MSYTRKYRDSITVNGSKTVTFSYPASQNGGSRSETVNYSQTVPIDINILVDTNPFESSIRRVNGNIDLLTGAVVATESAEIVSKDRNAKKVGSSIVNGFFSYIKSEISQQISELTQSVNAQLGHIKELSQTCLSKKKQMEGDFNRISSRYVKIFDDLNHELSNRILELDKSTFLFKKETDNQKIRTSNNDLVNTIAISGKEGSNLQAQISTSIAKKRAFDTLNKAIIFLRQQKKMNDTIQKSMFNENVLNSFYLKCCYIETNNINNQIDKNIYNVESLKILTDKHSKNKLIEQFSSYNIKWIKPSWDLQNNIAIYFNAELNNSLTINNPHTVRVKEMIRKMAKISSIDVNDFQ